jgi:N-acetylneuraminic acid mutarotase
LARERFIRETRLVSTLQHFHICILKTSTMNPKRTGQLLQFFLLAGFIYLLSSCACDNEPLISSFAFNDLTPAALGEISQSTFSIKVKVPVSTDVTHLSPTITVDNPECHTVSPPSNTSQDFSDPVMYEVTNESGDMNRYEVTVTFDETIQTLEIAWEERTLLPVPTGWMPAVELDNKIYVIGGILDGPQLTNHMYVYDPATDTWDNTRASLSLARFAHSAEVVNGKIYVLGGAPGAADALADIQVYDPQKDAWQSEGNMPFGRAAFGSCVLDGKIYVVGGELEEPTQNVISDVSVYDPSTGIWTALAPLSTPRCYLTAEVVNGKIYAAGGTPETPWDGSNVMEEYDPVTNTWTEKTDMLAGRWALGSCMINEMIFYMGGTPTPMTPGSPTSQICDPSENKWYKGTNMTMNRLGAAVCSYQGQILVIGGSVSGVPWAINTNSVSLGTPEWE